MPVFLTWQDGKQASCIYIDGGQVNQVSNEFRDHTYNFESYLRLSPGLYDSAHESYLLASQGPLINIYLPDIGFLYQAKQVFENNHFHRNRHHYTLVEEKAYQASLIVINSELADAEFTFTGNRVEYNSFVGAETALISISGPPIMKIQNNQFMANGKLSS